MTAFNDYTQAGDEPPFAVPPGNRRRLSINLVGPTAYECDGSEVDAEVLGFNSIDHVQIGSNLDGTLMAVWDSANKKIKVFCTEEAPWVEVLAANEDLSSETFPATVWGL